MRRVRVTIVAVEKQQVLHTLVCVSVALVCPALPYCSTLPHKRHDFWGKIIEHTCFDFVNFLSDTFLILRRIQRYIITVHTSSCEVPVILVRF